MRPRIVMELRDPEGAVTTRYEPEVVRKVVSRATSEKLRAILEGVVSEGTGKNAYVSGYRVAGKTGTSETTEEGRYIASFCAFAPADDPQVVALVVLDDPAGEHMGGAVAAPVAQGLLEDVLEYMGVERRYGGDGEGEARVTVPDLRGLTVAEAEGRLADLGLEALVPGEPEDDAGPTVTVQVPAPDNMVAEGGVVALYTGAAARREMTVVPDVTGMGVVEAADALRGARLNIGAQGSGEASSQGTEPGAEAEVGAIVDVRFRYMDGIE
jgi:stage V sporulation protein D (sporulation-specific penicillin-binding protein)